MRILFACVIQGCGHLIGKPAVVYKRERRGYLSAMRKASWVLLLAVAAGCSNQLETGYKPQSLGASSSLRRSYYASPFTPEAQNADADRDAEVNARRPRPGY